jgi:DNA polymerase-3 subunit alpha
MSESIVETAVNITKKERDEANRDYPGPTEFVHLHNHTLFSPLDGIATPEQYFSACAELGNPAFSITDHGSLANIPDAYWAAKQHKVKFIPGCEIYYSPDHPELKRLQKDPEFKLGALRPDYGKSVFTTEEMDSEERYSDFRRQRHLSVLAMNMVGYRNLIQMTTEAWHDGFYYKPRIWFDKIKQYHEGLIILSGCLNGPVSHYLRRAEFWKGVEKGEIKQIVRHVRKEKRTIDLNVSREEAAQRRQKSQQTAIETIKSFKELMGDRYYLEMQMPGEEIPFGKGAFRQTAMISKALGVKAVLTNDCHYLNRPDFKVQKCMMAIDQGLSINDPNLFHVNSDEQFFKSRAQLRKTYHEGGYDQFITPERFEEICDNTVALSERCSGFQPDLNPKLPAVPEAGKKLRALAYQSLKDKGLWDKDEKFLIDGKAVTYKQQTDIELERYIEKGFASYFLIIRDLIAFSRKNKWEIGPGRGSAGGSLVCFLVGIHSIDPLAWGLSSVRFMGDSRGGRLLNIKMT